MTTLRRMIRAIDSHTLWAFNPRSGLDPRR
ncbi:MAG: hypothetical protein JWQ67_623 [Marmoricola sp.]|jgi:hypothetical protein|nr:hypothetical protein [Marmoricola sp.]MCW2820784.1 hypothetical protein [Marmoricola sp.]MCW2827007.1 hypothetical protein [Marmoricola sp.]MCW2837976.1 hypothetical protein [Marmoricola sp.]